MTFKTNPSKFCLQWRHWNEQPLKKAISSLKRLQMYPLVHVHTTWICLPFIRSGKNHLARHSERGNRVRQTEREMGRKHQGMDRPGVHKVPEGSREERKWMKLVVKSSVVPQGPPRSGDRWRWRCILLRSEDRRDPLGAVKRLATEHVSKRVTSWTFDFFLNPRLTNSW